MKRISAQMNKQHKNMKLEDNRSSIRMRIFMKLLKIFSLFIRLHYEQRITGIKKDTPFQLLHILMNDNIQTPEKISGKAPSKIKIFDLSVAYIKCIK